jgi:hypothetical protein
MIKKGNNQKNNLSKLMVALALGALITLPGIAACKKSNSSGVTTHQIYPAPNYSGQDIGQAPLPGTLTLLGSGLAGLGLMGWRKRKNKPDRLPDTSITGGR